MKKEIEKIEKEILSRFKEDSIFIFSFGSITKDKHFNIESDIDFAVYLKKVPLNFSSYEYLQDFRLKMERDIDFIVLNKADIIITMQILENGKLLFCKDDEFLINFKLNKRREYIEFKKFRKPLEDKILEN